MLNEGHSIEDIFDSGKLQNERYSAMEQVVKHTVEQPDWTWETDQFRRGGERWISEVNRFAQKCDLGNPNAPLTDERLLLTTIGVSCYDYFQEYKRPFTAIKEGSAPPRPTEELAALETTLDAYGQKLTNLRTVCMGLISGTNARAELALNNPKETLSALNDTMKSVYSANIFAADVRANPGTNILDINTGEAYEMKLIAPNVLLGSTGTPESRRLANVLNGSGSAKDSVRDMAARGALAQHMKVNADTQKFKVELHMDDTLLSAAGLKQPAAQKEKAAPQIAVPHKAAPSGPRM